MEELFAEKTETVEEVAPLEHKEFIGIEELDKVELRVGKILSCEKHPKADRLLVSQFKLGPETRQIVRGVESQGMIRAAGNDGDDLIVPVATGANDGCEVR